MHHPSLNKYLLLAALALAVLVFDAYINRSRPGPNQESSNHNQISPTISSSAAKPLQTIAALSVVQDLVAAPASPTTLAPPVDCASETQLCEKLAQQLANIENDYKSMAVPIYDQSAPIVSPEDRTKLAYLDQEKFQDLGKVLSPTELEVYQNKIDETAAPKRR